MRKCGYPPEFRRRVLDLVEVGRKVADDLGIRVQTIYNWRRQDRIDRGLETGMSSADKAVLDLVDLLDDKYLDGSSSGLELSAIGPIPVSSRRVGRGRRAVRRCGVREAITAGFGKELTGEGSAVASSAGRPRGAHRAT